MTYPNRELSQFASFLRVNDVNQKIAITTSATPYIGIGLTNPSEKLEVLGNIKASGVVSATQYFGDGSSLSNVTAIVNGYFVNTVSGIWTGSSVGIGTTLFPNKLNVNGNVGGFIFYSNAPTGTAPLNIQSTTRVNNLNVQFLSGLSAPSSNIVGESDDQILENKTLVQPDIAVIKNGSASLTVPSTSGTLISSGSSGIITSGMYANGSINDSAVAVGAGISYAKLNLGNAIKSSDIDPNNRIQNNKLVNSTISGVSLGSNLLNLVSGSYIDGGSYNGSGIVTFSVRASVDTVPNTLVARDANGNVNIQGANFTGAIPIGGIIMWSGATVPSSWALCNGATVNGVVTPDLRDRFIVGSGSAYNIGNTGGAISVTLSVAQMPAHAHGGVTNTDFPDHAHNVSFKAENVPASPSQTSVITPKPTPNFTVGSSGATARHQHAITAEGGSSAHENRPPYYALAFIMRVQ